MIPFATQKEIKIGEAKVIANYPNVRQKMEIEKIKLFLTDGMYGDMARSGHFSSLDMLNLVDSFSTLMVCCPDLKLDRDKFDKLTSVLEKTFIKAYTEEVFPWFQEIKKELDDVQLTDGKEE